MLSALALIGAPGQATALTPYASREPLRLAKPDVPETSPRDRTLTIDVDAAGTYADPFDPAQVRLDAKVTEADGRTYSVPGYIDRPYRRSLDGDKETVTPDGQPRWRIRVCPEKEGTTRIRITFADGSGEKVQNVAFEATASDEKGFVRVSPDDRRYFAFSNGGSYWPLGPNLAWAGSPGNLRLRRLAEQATGERGELRATLAFSKLDDPGAGASRKAGGRKGRRPNRPRERLEAGPRARYRTGEGRLRDSGAGLLRRSEAERHERLVGSHAPQLG